MTDRVIWLTESKRVIVCGSRDYDEADHVGRVLDEHIGEAADHETAWPVLVHGDAPGADQLADEWAAGKNVLVEPHPADWVLHGKAGGPIRNQEMADAGADLCVAFPGGKGTADMVRRAKAAGIPVLEVAEVPA